MRITVTLDEDVAAGIKRGMERSGESFKQLVNKLMRLGFGLPHPAVAKKSKVRPSKRRKRR